MNVLTVCKVCAMQSNMLKYSQWLRVILMCALVAVPDHSLSVVRSLSIFK